MKFHFLPLLLAVGTTSAQVYVPTPGAPPQPGAPTDTVVTPRAGTCARASRIPGYLDRFQTPGDGKVVFCHRTSAGSWTRIDTSTSACIHHAGHLLDLFPRTLCDN
jgi:hypothetical protein